MKIGLYINATKFAPKDKQIEEFLLENADIEFFLPKEDFDYFNFQCYTKVMNSLDDVDILMSIGGDGTVLSTIRRAQFTDKPLIGLKFGNLGFLTAVNFRDFKNVKENLLSGNYKIDTRALVEVEKFDENNVSVYKDYALNDVVVEREDIARMSTIDAFVDNEFFTTYHSNGVVISSPTGSTAYNLSAGGPIVYPDSRAIILTPICPHSLSQRPVVINHRVVELRLRGRVKLASLTLDGQKEQEVVAGDRILAKISEKSINLIKLDNESFPSILRQKLSWGI